MLGRLRNITPCQLALLLAAGATLTIAAALAYEHLGGYRPCPLCLKERIAYYAAIPAGLLAALMLATGRQPFGRTILVLAALGLVWNAGLGVYHSGVEWKWWAGPTECGSLGDLATGGSIIEGIETEKRIRCDEASWRFLGLSFAGWSAVISLGLAVVGFAAAFRRPSTAQV
ncbi:MAG: disulfide bond formation protein B [Hyphomicrobiaceae bacterium]